MRSSCKKKVLTCLMIGATQAKEDGCLPTKPKKTFSSQFVVPESTVPVAPPIPDLRSRSGRLLSRLLKQKQFHRWAKKKFPRMNGDNLETVASTAVERIDIALRTCRAKCVTKFMISGRISIGEYRSFMAFAHRVTLYAAHEAYRLQKSVRLVTNTESIEVVTGDSRFDKHVLELDELDVRSLSLSALRHAKTTLDSKCFHALMHRIRGRSYAEIGKLIGGNRNTSSALIRIACRNIGEFLEGTVPPRALAVFIQAEVKRDPSFMTTNQLGFSVCEPGLRLAEIGVSHQHVSRRNRVKRSIPQMLSTASGFWGVHESRPTTP